jgi:hypothetical protein
MNRIMRGRSRGHVVLLGAALVALAFGVSVGLAKSGPGQVATTLYPGPKCPGSTSKKSFGTATLIREKGVITARAHLRGAEPGKYFLGLVTPFGLGGACSNASLTFFVFGVDSSGDGQGSGSFVGVPGQTFAVGVYHEGGVTTYFSPLVKLGSS